MGTSYNFTILFFAIALFAVCESKHVIDLEEHASVFTSNNCFYVDDYNDNYWAWGCPSNVHEYEHEENGAGFWSACKKRSCDMLYFNLEEGRPASVHIDAHVSGTGVLEVSGKRTPTFPEFYYTIAQQIAGEDRQCSGTMDANLLNFQDEDIFAVNITAASDRNGYVLIDKITICFENDTDCPGPATKAFTCVEKPPVAPPTTTPGPNASVPLRHSAIVTLATVLSYFLLNSF